jgi:hypothetical protein
MHRTATERVELDSPDFSAKVSFCDLSRLHFCDLIKVESIKSEEVGLHGKGGSLSTVQLSIDNIDSTTCSCDDEYRVYFCYRDARYQLFDRV